VTIPTLKNSHPSGLIRKSELLDLLQVSDPTIWRWEKSGKFPKRVKIGPNSVAWLRREVETWLEQLAEAR